MESSRAGCGTSSLSASKRCLPVSSIPRRVLAIHSPSEVKCGAFKTLHRSIGISALALLSVDDDDDRDDGETKDSIPDASGDIRVNDDSNNSEYNEMD
jgi:hypothetical protein